MNTENREIMVSVLCATYNHRQYIERCLMGFVMQKTSFPIEVIVHDDASTDGTSQIVKEYAARYPKIITPILETENQWSKHDGTITRIFRKTMRGKYLASCEGDDYWTDPYKLQKQVDFLEEHEDYGMVYTRAKVLCGSKFIGENGTSDTSFEGLIKYSNFPTLTRVYRRSIFERFHHDIKIDEKGWMMGDYPIAFYFVAESKVKYLDDCTAVYRVLDESASHSKDVDFLFKFYDSADDVRRFFVERYITDVDKLLYYEKLIKENEISYKISILLSKKRLSEAKKYLDNQGRSLKMIKRWKYRLCFYLPCLYKIFVIINRINSKIIKIWEKLH